MIEALSKNANGRVGGLTQARRIEMPRDTVGTKVGNRLVIVQQPPRS